MPASLVKKILLLAAPAAIYMPAPDAHAAVTIARAAPASRSYASDRPVTVNIVWQITRSGVAGNVLVESDDGDLFIGSSSGTLLQTRDAIERTYTAAAGVSRTTLTESFTVSRDFVRQAIEAGQPLVYRRRFTDNGFNSSIYTDYKINFSGGGIGASIGVSRMRLAFADGSAVCSAAASEDITATAYIETEGSGLLRGAWQVREGQSEPAFRTIKTVSVPVSAGKDLTLESPPLPSGSTGFMEVRFDITQPAIEFEEPFIACAIGGADEQLAKTPLAGTPVEIVSPRQFTPLNAETMIEWAAKDGAKAYRIEILAERNGQPVAAQDVKGDATSSKLSPLTLDKLNPKRRYMVRVLAQ